MIGRRSGPVAEERSIYTPDAGSMIIHVHRESGPQNRTIVLSARQVRLLGFLTSRLALGLVVLVVASWGYLASQASRVPALNAELARLRHDAARMDTLQAALVDLQRQYVQMRRMLEGPGD